MSHRFVALLRGVNVGTARRISMQQLRESISGLGFTDVRTVLNSGNVVFIAAGVDAAEAARRIEAALAAHFGAPVRATVLDGDRLADIVPPLAAADRDPSRLLVAFLSDDAGPRDLEPVASVLWTPEEFAVGAAAAYLWCPLGVAASPLAQAVGRALRDRVTMRNWTTALRIALLLA